MSTNIPDPHHRIERPPTWSGDFEREKLPIALRDIHESDISEDMLALAVDTRLNPTSLVKLTSDARVAMFVGTALESAGVQVDMQVALERIDEIGKLSTDAKQTLLDYVKGIEWWKKEASAFVDDALNVDANLRLLRRQELIAATEEFEDTNVIRAVDIIAARYAPRFSKETIPASRIIRAMFLVPGPAPPSADYKIKR